MIRLQKNNMTLPQIEQCISLLREAQLHNELLNQLYREGQTTNEVNAISSSLGTTLFGLGLELQAAKIILEEKEAESMKIFDPFS